MPSADPSALEREWKKQQAAKQAARERQLPRPSAPAPPRTPPRQLERAVSAPTGVAPRERRDYDRGPRKPEIAPPPRAMPPFMPYRAWSERTAERLPTAAAPFAGWTEQTAWKVPTTGPTRGPGLRSPQREGGPFNEFMEQSIYPRFDRFGQEVPFWSQLMNIENVQSPEDYWRYLEYWNWLMRGPRELWRGR